MQSLEDLDQTKIVDIIPPSFLKLEKIWVTGKLVSLKIVNLLSQL